MTDTRNTQVESPVLARTAVAIGLVALTAAIITHQVWVVLIAVIAVIVGVVAATRNPTTRATATVGALLGAIASGIVFFL